MYKSVFLVSAIALGLTGCGVFNDSPLKVEVEDGADLIFDQIIPSQKVHITSLKDDPIRIYRVEINGGNSCVINNWWGEFTLERDETYKGRLSCMASSVKEVMVESNQGVLRFNF